MTCGYVARSTNVVIANARVSRCGAFFDTGFLPWQADGFDIGSSSENVTLDRPRIDQVWEGIDVVAGGTGIRNLAITDAVISDVFAFGIKLGYSLSDVRVERPTVTRAAYDGIIVYGPVRNAVIRDADALRDGLFRPRPGAGAAVGGNLGRRDPPQQGDLRPIARDRVSRRRDDRAGPCRQPGPPGVLTSTASSIPAPPTPA